MLFPKPGEALSKRACCPNFGDTQCFLSSRLTSISWRPTLWGSTFQEKKHMRHAWNVPTGYPGGSPFFEASASVAVAWLWWWTCPTLWIILTGAKRREWIGMGVAGIIIDSYCGSFPHSLLSTSKYCHPNKVPKILRGTPDLFSIWVLPNELPWKRIHMRDMYSWIACAFQYCQTICLI